MDQRSKPPGRRLALAGEDLKQQIQERVRVALASCEALFRVREPNNRRALEARAERHRPQVRSVVRARLSGCWR